MLEVHAPHEPLTTWKGFFIHIATISIGLLIAIGLEQTVEYFHHREQAATFAEHLKADLREEDWVYELLLAYNREVLASANRAVAALEGKAAPSDETLLVDAYRATQYKTRRTRRPTYNELISTGSIGMIRDQKLRETAMALYSSTAMEDLAHEGRDSRYREAFRMSIPSDVHRALGRQCGDLVIEVGDFSAINGVLDHPCSTGLPGQAIQEAVKALRSNPAIVGTLRLRVADLETRLNDLTSNNRVLWENLKAIARQEP
jgi:hypothetical protein